jgi:hypothetical protein
LISVTEPAPPSSDDQSIPAAEDETKPQTEDSSEPLPPPPEDIPPPEDVPLEDIPPPEDDSIEDVPPPKEATPLAENENAIDIALMAMPKSGLTPSVSEEQNDDDMSTRVNYNSDSVDTFSTVNDDEQKLEQKESLADESTSVNGTAGAEEGVGGSDLTAIKKSPGVDEQIVEVEIHQQPDGK